MDAKLRSEIERLTHNAALRREDLLSSALRKSAMRKALNVAAGILALLSAGTITAVISRYFGASGLELVAAIAALTSGIITLLLTAYFGDDEIISMFNASSKYLALRESVYSLVTDPGMPDKDRRKLLTELQHDYARLDESYSRYFSMRARTNEPPPKNQKDREHAMDAARIDVAELNRRIDSPRI